MRAIKMSPAEFYCKRTSLALILSCAKPRVLLLIYLFDLADYLSGSSLRYNILRYILHAMCFSRIFERNLQYFHGEANFYYLSASASKEIVKGSGSGKLIRYCSICLWG